MDMNISAIQEGVLMPQEDILTLQDYADAFAFFGNTLLIPMNQGSTIGLEPLFWEAMPDFGSTELAEAKSDFARFAETLKQDSRGAVSATSVEYAHLFIGPPMPLAAPWESFYEENGANVGFGSATFEMRQRLRQAELSVIGGQYEDHMGVELLLLSELIGRSIKEGINPEGLKNAREFAQEHPCSWIGPFYRRAEEVSPDGFYARILLMTDILLRTFV
jgi:putative dimethyl sulfoxide reductase chaperone